MFTPIKIGTWKKNAWCEPVLNGLLFRLVRTACTPGMTAMSK
jgi:hypothetical protein